MPTQELKNRLREALIVDERGFAEAAETTIAQMAEIAAPGAEAVLDLTRLAFSLPIEKDATAAFDAGVANAGLQLDPRAQQLRRVLAGCVLVARFELKRARASRASLDQDTICALACRLLERAGHVAVIPDVAQWAQRWLHETARTLRSAGVRSKPPEFSVTAPSVDEALPPAAMVTSAFEAVAGELATYTNELRDWAGQIDPAAVRAQREQVQLLWWISSAWPQERDLVETVVAAARELHALTEFVPGPSAARELLARRIGARSDERLRLTEVQSALASVPPPTVLADFVTLHAATPTPDSRELKAADLGAWIFDERQLIELAARSI
jgi:hypothetical protein